MIRNTSMSNETSLLGLGRVTPQRFGPNAVLGMLLFVCAEAMFFIALISAFLVIKGERGFVIPYGIKLPQVSTLYNTSILLLSGLLLAMSTRKLSADKRELNPEGRTFFIWASLLGALFVGFQGAEWVSLIYYGLSMRSSIFGALFFLLIGSHAIHALAGVVAMAMTLALGKGRISLVACQCLQVFWYLVVAVWPVLYGLVYF